MLCAPHQPVIPSINPTRNKKLLVLVPRVHGDRRPSTLITEGWQRTFPAAAVTERGTRGAAAALVAGRSTAPAQYRKGPVGSRLTVSNCLALCWRAFPRARLSVSVQFISKSIESWFDLKLDLPLEGGITRPVAIDRIKRLQARRAHALEPPTALRRVQCLLLSGFATGRLRRRDRPFGGRVLDERRGCFRARAYDLPTQHCCARRAPGPPRRRRSTHRRASRSRVGCFRSRIRLAD